METPTPEVPATPETAPAGRGSTAEKYIANELFAAQKALRTTQIVGIVLVAFITIYMGYMTAKVTGYAQPATAAEVAIGIIGEKVETGSSAAAESFKEQIPVIMKQLPDTVIATMPQAREALEEQVETDLRKYCKGTSDELGKHFDAFLKLHKDELKTVFEVGADKAALHKIGPSLEKELMGFISAPPEGGGDSAKAKIDKALNVLKEIKAKTTRLATAKNLTTEERKTKRAIAIISHTVNKELKNINLQQAVVDHVLAPMTKGDESVAAPAESTSPAANSNSSTKTP